MTFNKRTVEPSTSNKYYISVLNKGVNECIRINKLSGFVLANCVGYAWGRAYEAWGLKPKLSRGNAETWWNYKDGYTRGKIPKVGSIVCSRSGNDNTVSDGYGHVAFVEEVYNDGSILVSDSVFNGSKFRLIKRDLDNYAPKGQILQGFIYPPVTFSSEKYELFHQVKGYMNACDAYNRQNPVVNMKAGFYEIYKKYNGMFNISKNKAEPGAWINPTDNSMESKTIVNYRVKIIERCPIYESYYNTSLLQDVLYDGVYTIVEEIINKFGNKWGKLKSGVGYVYLYHTKKVV